jgi:hypothetical protein
MRSKARHFTKLGLNMPALAFQSSFVALLLASMSFLSGCALTSAGGNANLPSSVTIKSTALPTAHIQTVYQASLLATGGKPPYFWSVQAGSLPGGLSLTASSGTISGVPNEAGTSTFSAQVEDSSSPVNISTRQMQIQVTASTALTISNSNLPNGTIGKAYSASASATGGVAPYTWSVSSGSLPPGITLGSSNGAFSGTPGQTGSYSFQVQVKDSQAATAAASLSIVVNSTALAISTTNLPNGMIGTPYSTTLSSTGGTSPFTWLISSGQLPTGLTLNKSTGVISGTPQQSGSSTFIAQVTDSSSPTPYTATVQLSITISGGVAITTVSLPAGSVGASYSAAASANGGVAPYTWSVSSGSLPPGITLGSSNGTFSGTPGQTGSYSFQVQVKDSQAATAAASLSIIVDPANQNCGGPPVYCARSDMNLQLETPMSAPSVNAVFNDPDFGSRMVRVTNANVLAGVGHPNLSYATNSSSEQNTWNTDSTYFYVIGTGGNYLLYSFIPSSMQATWDPIPGSFNNALPVSGDAFSRIDPNTIYGWIQGSSQSIGQYDISTNTTTDLVDTANCVPGLTKSHMGDVSVSAGDQRLFIYEGGTQQDTDMFVVTYDKTLGCRWYNTQTGQIGGQWGPTGSATVGTSFLLHNARMAISGDWAVLDGTLQRYVWQIGTLNVYLCSINSTPYCGGHNVGGYTHLINSSGTVDDMNAVIRPFTAPLSPVPLINPLPTPVEWTFDKHWSWNDDNSSDTMPVCGSTYMESIGGTAITRPWDREVICIRTDGVQSQVWRFAHNRSVYNGDFWSTPRGNVSQDGKFYMFTSDWENQLGLQTGSTTLYREDVFIVELQ